MLTQAVIRQYAVGQRIDTEVGIFRSWVIVTKPINSDSSAKKDFQGISNWTFAWCKERELETPRCRRARAATQTGRIRSGQSCPDFRRQRCPKIKALKHCLIIRTLV